MNSDELELQNLGIHVKSQSTVEQQIEQDVENYTTAQALADEQKRLERAQNALHKINSKRRMLQKKLGDTSRISVKHKVKAELQTLDETERANALDDISQIRSRIRELQGEHNGEDEELVDGRRPHESENDFLIRTGKITAFGSKTGFSVSSESHPENQKIEEARDVTKVPSSEDEDLSHYTVDEDSIEDTPKIEVKDDGDEYSYQKRLHQWITKRSALRSSDPQPEAPEWRKPNPAIPDAKLNDSFRIPGEIYTSLFDYQKTCVQWLYELYQARSGGIIGDEMGLGKTIQLIAFLAGLHYSGDLDGPVLIVCPATVMKQWCSELHRWWPPLRAIILHSIGSGMTGKGSLDDEELEDLILKSEANDFSYEEYVDIKNNKKAKLENTQRITALIEKVVTEGHVLITTYVGLRIHSDKLLNVKWKYAVLDEGHKIRNPDSAISLTCKRLKTRNRIILSGTPIQNNLNELWSLFDFIRPGKLGTLPIFQQQFVIPINTGGYSNATNVQVQTGYKCAVALRNIIAPYMLRRLKTDVAKDLPEKKELVLFCKLTQYQRTKYLEFLNSEDLAKIKSGKRQVLYGIDILRKICNHPDLLDRQVKRYEKSYGNPKRSGKMQVVKQLLLLWKKEGHKTLLFTQSRQMLDILEEFVQYKDGDLSDIRYLRMDGTTDISIRQSLVDKFNTGPYDLFLLTTRVGGLGVNLTGSNRIIIFDPDWNPSTDMQARERAWRIGQKREVTIYRLMIAGSIEEKIYHRQIFKQFLTNRVLTSMKQKRFFKMNELQDLFSLGGEDGHASETLLEEVHKSTEKLKQSATAEGDDFETVVQLNGVQKLESFYAEKDTKDKVKTDDDRLIEGLIGSQNLQEAATQEQMIQSHATASSKIISREADRIAKRALDAIRQSRNVIKKRDITTPTWTGKFGEAGKVQSKRPSNFGSKRLPAGSASILKGIQELQQNSKKQVVSSDMATKDLTKETHLLERIISLLKSEGGHMASSKAIIDELGMQFSNREDVAKVRALLKSVASFDKDTTKWRLNDEFRSRNN